MFTAQDIEQLEALGIKAKTMREKEVLQALVKMLQNLPPDMWGQAIVDFSKPMQEAMKAILRGYTVNDRRKFERRLGDVRGLCCNFVLHRFMEVRTRAEKHAAFTIEAMKFLNKGQTMHLLAMAYMMVKTSN